MENDTSANNPLGGSLDLYDMEVDRELMSAAEEMKVTEILTTEIWKGFFGQKSRQREFMCMPVARWGYRRLTENDVDMLALQNSITS